MQVIVKSSKVTQDVIKAIKEVNNSKKSKGTTSNGIKFIKSLTSLILF